MSLEERNAPFSNLSFEEAIVDSLDANIAVIDARGEIIAVNAKWQHFAIANRMNDNTSGVGANYFDVCRAAGADPNARAALNRILELLSGKRSVFYHEYPCHSPWQQRWFALRATPLVDNPDCVVVSHEDITARVSAVMTFPEPEGP
jgi:PAS domain-containing protein